MLKNCLKNMNSSATEKILLKKALKNDFLLIVSSCMFAIGIIFFILYKIFGLRFAKHGFILDVSIGEDHSYEIISIVITVIGIISAVL